MENLKAVDDESIKLSLSLKDFSLYEKMKNNPYEIIEIDSSLILSFNSSYKDIELPFVENISDIKISLIPVPEIEFKTDIFIPSTDILIDNVICKSYGSQNVELLRFDHALFKFEINLKDLKIHYKVEENFTSARRARLFFGFLDALVNTDSGITLTPYPSNNSNVPTEDITIQFSISKKENSPQQKEIHFIYDLLNKIILIEDHYKVKFEQFHFNINEEESFHVELLIANIRSEPFITDKFPCYVPFTEFKRIKEEVLNKDVLVQFEVTEEITVELYGKNISIKNRIIQVAANSIYMINEKEVRRQLKNHKETLLVILGSRTGNFTYQFKPAISKVLADL
ncbi:hypothetical protein [Planococcus soli]|uniref:hypothetical protein n=1 Tax=Planococcus soli TaxID=2666072 RepID=UPI00115D9412|nr:hypothetical protein [Planococcus soli]